MGNSGLDGQESRLCTKCNSPLTFVTKYNRWYCYQCKTYDNGGNGSSVSDSKVVPERSEFKCSTCGEVLFFIREYDSHFCYKCNAYQTPSVSDARLPGGEVSDIQGYEEPVTEEPTCPDCGVEIDDDWIRCPNCGSALGGQMTERPVTTPDDRPADGYYQERPKVVEEPVPQRASPSSERSEDWDGRHDGVYRWETGAKEEGSEWQASADEETHGWRSTAADETSERDMAASEERDGWEKNASMETRTWRRDAHQETKAWSDEADEEEEDRDVDAEDERKEWEEANEPMAEVETKADAPDEHAEFLDQEVEFLVDMFQEILTEFLKDPPEPISFYRSKMKVLSRKHNCIRKVKVGDDGQVRIFIEINDFERVLDSLGEIFDNLVLTEAKISTKAKAMARAKEVLEPVIEEYEEELDDFGITHRILKGAFATKLPSGIPGFDEMLHGGIPNGASIIVQGATGGEKEMFANQFISQGLRDGGAVMVAITMISPDEWRTQMKSIHTKTRKFEKEGQVVIVDWYTHKNERVRSVEARDSVILSSKSITNLEIAVDKAIKVVRDAPTKRAIIAVLSPAIKSLGFDKVYGFAQSIRGKFKKYGITGLFLLEKKMHDERVVTSLHSVFDGVFDIERQRVGDAMVRKIGVISLKGVTFDSTYKELELTRDGLAVKR